MRIVCLSSSWRVVLRRQRANSQMLPRRGSHAAFANINAHRRNRTREIGVSSMRGCTLQRQPSKAPWQSRGVEVEYHLFLVLSYRTLLAEVTHAPQVNNLWTWQELINLYLLFFSTPFYVIYFITNLDFDLTSDTSVFFVRQYGISIDFDSESTTEVWISTIWVWPHFAASRQLSSSDQPDRKKHPDFLAAKGNSQWNRTCLSDSIYFHENEITSYITRNIFI